MTKICKLDRERNGVNLKKLVTNQDPTAAAVEFISPAWSTAVALRATAGETWGYGA